MELLTALVLISLSISVVSILIRPKPKQPRPDAVRDLEAPTAEAGRPVPRVYGSMRIRGVNTLDTREKGTNNYRIKV